MIAPQPSWEGITFHDNVGDDKCAQFLAEHGITLDEADTLVTMATDRGIGRFTIPSLAEFGQLSLQPSTSGSAEPAAVATETLVEVVAMMTDPPEDPLPPLPESPIVEDDPILINDDHTMPALANMVE